MTTTSLKNQPGHTGVPSCPGYLHGLELVVGACGQCAHKNPSRVRSQKTIWETGWTPTSILPHIRLGSPVDQGSGLSKIGLLEIRNELS